MAIPASEVMKKKIIQNEMSKTFFIFSSIPKVKYYGLVLGEPNIYHDSGDFTRMWEDCGGLSDCEELVGVTHRR